MEKKIRRLAPEVEYLNKKRSKNENKEKLRGRNKIYQEKFLELQCRSFKMERGHQMHRMWLKRDSSQTKTQNFTTLVTERTQKKLQREELGFTQSIRN